MRTGGRWACAILLSVFVLSSCSRQHHRPCVLDESGTDWPSDLSPFQVVGKTYRAAGILYSDHHGLFLFLDRSKESFDSPKASMDTFCVRAEERCWSDLESGSWHSIFAVELIVRFESADADMRCPGGVVSVLNVLSQEPI